MAPREEIPIPHRPIERRGTHVEPPSVYLESRWEYHELVRDAGSSSLASEADLDTLGAEGWELVGVVTLAPQVYYYFKRERTRGSGA